MALTRLGGNQSINLATNVTGTLATGNGGTGLTSGTTDQILKFTGSTTMASAAQAAGGKVLQVVHSNITYKTESTSTGDTDVLSGGGTTWETSITPSSTSSKILFMCTLSCHGRNTSASSGTEARGSLSMYEKIGSGSYSRFVYDYEGFGVYNFDAGGSWKIDNISKQMLRTPNTTSAVSYKFQITMISGATAIAINEHQKESEVVLVEIGA